MADFDSNTSLTVEDAIRKRQKDVDSVLIEFDRWAAQNPHNMDPNNEQLRSYKNQLKIARLRLAEAHDIERTYRSQKTIEMRYKVPRSAVIHPALKTSNEVRSSTPVMRLQPT